ncbi:MAG: RNA polymerase sigma-70 factor [Bacteroidales bacterium]|nr:RNA polymerase sigma-70 factor [Bacteroidales bacterium]
MLPETDKYLIESIRKGDYAAYEIVFKSYYSMLCKYATGIVNNPDTAEDIVTDVLVRIWEFPEKINIHTSLKGYLIRSVRNACINYLTRRHKRFQELNPETIEKLNSFLPVPNSDIPADQMIGNELEAKLDQIICELPSECGKIFLLSRRESLSHREIATRLNISENTVKVQIYRALSKIREALKYYLE